MSATGYSVFAPYARVAPAAGFAAREGGACQDHQHAFTLTSLPPSLVRRATMPEEEAEDPSRRRTRIWEFSQNLHCSIIGTCLSTSELRQTLSGLGLARSGATDHDLHHQAVSLAAKHDQAAKLLHKALDRRHRLAISQFGKAKTDADLTALWRDAVKRGDIPGAYWAVLTHPAATQAVVRLVFGEVHMLSHLVGAANRADIRRLADLEQANATLEEKLRRQQAALHEAVTTRDASIRDLREALRRTLAAEAPVESGDGAEALRALVADLEKHLGASARRRETVEGRLAEARDALAAERAARERLEAEVVALRAELVAVEGSLSSDAAEDERRVDGLSLLYVGGYGHQVSHLRAIAARRGADLLHHDGGVEHNPDLLAGLTSRADAVLFPVDRVSHEAALAVKRLCRQSGKPLIPLRSSGASSLLAAIQGLASARIAAD
jgi:Uncharacterized protein conserved in bacteria (DUF2325)